LKEHQPHNSLGVHLQATDRSVGFDSPRFLQPINDDSPKRKSTDGDSPKQFKINDYEMSQ